MKEFNFRYLFAKNFLSIGPEGIEIFFDKMGRITLVRGKNGVGKSTIADILVYALYGKPVRDLGVNEVINNVIKGDTCVELIWSQYRVVRTRRRNNTKVDTVQLWESTRDDWSKTNDISTGSKDETQNEISKKIGMGYHAFVNSVVFADTNATNFLECNTEERRGVVDDLFQLHKFRQYFKYCNEKKKSAKKDYEAADYTYQMMLGTLATAKSRVTQVEQQVVEWKRIKEQERQRILASIEAKRKELTATDDGVALEKYLQAQEKIRELGEEIPLLEAEEAEYNQLAVTGHAEMEKVRTNRERHAAERQGAKTLSNAATLVINGQQQLVDSLTQMVGCKCPTCYGEVQEKNFAAVLEHAKQVIHDKKTEYAASQSKISSLDTEITRLDVEIKQFSDGIAQCKKQAAEIRAKLTKMRSDITTLGKIKKPEVGTDTKIVEQQIADLQTQAEAKQVEVSGVSPYETILRTAREEVEKKRKEATEKNAEREDLADDIPHWEFLVDAFDEEIRKFVIDPILPALNSRIQFWLQILMDGVLECIFDQSLYATIRRAPYGDPDEVLKYEGLSGGQRRELNLSISQSFAHVITLSSGVFLPFAFLDEVDQNVDETRIVGIYKMIQELSKDKQVFITTHSRELQDMLAGCDTLDIVAEDGFTKIARSS